MTKPIERCTGILLAGGYGRRYAAEQPGADKLLARLPDGRPVAVASAQVLLQALQAVHAVVRPESTELAALLAAEGCVVVPADRARQGMGASLAAAAQALIRQPGPDRCLVALADMPWLRAETVAHLAALSAGHAIAAPCYRGRRGHPVAFAAALWPELCQLTGDEGARAVLQRHGLHAVEVDDPGVVADIDLPVDLAGGAGREEAGERHPNPPRAGGNLPG